MAKNELAKYEHDNTLHPPLEIGRGKKDHPHNSSSPQKSGRRMKGNVILPQTIEEEFLEVRSNRTQRTRDHLSTNKAATTAANKVDDGKN